MLTYSTCMKYSAPHRAPQREDISAFTLQLAVARMFTGDSSHACQRTAMQPESHAIDVCTCSGAVQQHAASQPRPVGPSHPSGASSAQPSGQTATQVPAHQPARGQLQLQPPAPQYQHPPSSVPASGSQTGHTQQYGQPGSSSQPARPQQQSYAASATLHPALAQRPGHAWQPQQGPSSLHVPGSQHGKTPHSQPASLTQAPSAPTGLPPPLSSTAPAATMAQAAQTSGPSPAGRYCNEHFLLFACPPAILQCTRHVLSTAGSDGALFLRQVAFNAALRLDALLQDPRAHALTCANFFCACRAAPGHPPTSVPAADPQTLTALMQAQAGAQPPAPGSAQPGIAPRQSISLSHMLSQRPSSGSLQQAGAPHTHDGAAAAVDQGRPSGGMGSLSPALASQLAHSHHQVGNLAG